MNRPTTYPPSRVARITAGIATISLVLTTLLAVAVAYALIASPQEFLATTVAVELAFEPALTAQVAGAPASIASALADVPLDHPEARRQVLGPVLLLLFAIGAALVLVRRLASRIAGGRPFDPKNALDLRRLAWLALAHGLVLAPVASFVASGLDVTVVDSGLAVDSVRMLDLNLTPFAVALVLFTLSHAFAQGAGAGAGVAGEGAGGTAR